MTKGRKSKSLKFGESKKLGFRKRVDHWELTAGLIRRSMLSYLSSVHHLKRSIVALDHMLSRVNAIVYIFTQVKSYIRLAATAQL